LSLRDPDNSEIVRATRRSGRPTPAGYVPADSGRGRKPTAPSRDALRTVADVAAGLPASAGKALQVCAGAVGPLVFEFAVVRVWGGAAPHARPSVLAVDPPVSGGRAAAS
jgi:hypothetical protein